MTETSYKKIMGYFADHEKWVLILNVADRIITVFVAAAYIISLGWLFVTDRGRLIPVIVVPAVTFILVSLFRKVFNARRPYEKYGIPSALKKDTVGKSFPSRHVFSVFVIATTLYAVNPVLSAVLLVLGIVLSIIRVVGGVHFIKDVAAGAVIGVACGIAGICFFL